MAARSGSRKRRVGEPSITAAQRKKLLDTIRLGVNKDDAAKLAGIPRRTFFEWLEKGKQPDAPAGYRKFFEDVEVALIQVEQKRLGVIDRASAEEWQAAAWLLERKFPDRYGRRTRLDGNINVTATPVLDVSKLTLAEQEQLVNLLRKASPTAGELPEGQRPALELLPGGEGGT